MEVQGYHIVSARNCFGSGKDLTYGFEGFFRSPTPRPTASATSMATTTRVTRQIRLHPPRRAMYLLFLTSVNFSPFGPVTSQKLKTVPRRVEGPTATESTIAARLSRGLGQHAVLCNDGESDVNS